MGMELIKIFRYLIILGLLFLLICCKGNNAIKLNVCFNDSLCIINGEQHYINDKNISCTIRSSKEIILRNETSFIILESEKPKIFQSFNDALDYAIASVHEEIEATRLLIL